MQDSGTQGSKDYFNQSTKGMQIKLDPYQEMILSNKNYFNGHDESQNEEELAQARLQHLEEDK